MESLRADLDEWIYKTNDHGQIPEHPEVAFEADRHDEEQWAEYAERFDFDPRAEPQRYLNWWEERMRQMKEDA